MKQYFGIDIGGTAVKLGIVDETGRVLLKGEESVSFDGYQTPVLTTVRRAAKEFLTANAIPVENLAGIGVSATGQIDSRKGIVAGTCGAKGCWERYAATTALVRAAQEKDPDWKDGRAIFAAAEAGSETVLALLDHWTDEIAQGLAGMVHIFNPQLILIGGGVSAQQKLLIEPIAAKVKASVMPAFAEGLEVRAAQLHNDAGMVGAVYYFRQTMEKE